MWSINTVKLDIFAGGIFLQNLVSFVLEENDRSYELLFYKCMKHPVKLYLEVYESDLALAKFNYTLWKYPDLLK